MKHFKFPILILFAVLVSLQIYGQTDNSRKKTREEIKAKKITFISNELELTVEEAQKFWPLYNAMEKKIDELHKDMRQTMHAMHEKKDELSDADYTVIADKMIDTELAKAKVKKEYHEKFKKVLSSEKVLKLYKAEGFFREKLLKELKQRHSNKKNECIKNVYTTKDTLLGFNLDS